MTVDSINFICLIPALAIALVMHLWTAIGFERSLFLVHAGHLNLYFHLILQHKFLHRVKEPFQGLPNESTCSTSGTNPDALALMGLVPCSEYIMFKSTDTQGIKTPKYKVHCHWYFQQASDSLIQTDAFIGHQDTFSSCVQGRISCYLIS
jgi:hypothetical protein